MAGEKRTFLGLYCGPSADGVDAALVRIAGRGAEMQPVQKHALTRPLWGPLRERLSRVASGWAVPAADLAKLGRDVASCFARAAKDVLRAGHTRATSLAGVGLIAPSVGYVRPTPSAGAGALVELTAGPLVAQRLHVPVVSGFASSDLSAGGVGGPMWAWPDWLLFRDDRLSRVVVQLGAIASITFVGSAAAACEVVAFDTGPGTILIDALMKRLHNAPMDTDGAAAARGHVHKALLHELMAAEYFHQDPPKRSGAADWSGAAQERLESMAGKHRCHAGDLLTTVTELTARTVARDVLARTERPHEVILAGGGARNIHLAGRIRQLLSPCSTYAAERYGLALEAHAAVSCAILAAGRLDGFPAHCHAATGAKAPVVLGALWAP